MNTPEEMQGVINNVKGILGEFEAQEYFESLGYDAPIAENLFNPGFDIGLFDNEELVDVVQIKTTDNPEFIYNHLDKYPDIPVYATSDVYHKMDPHDNLEMLPFSSSHIEARIDDTFDNIDSLDTLEMGNIVEGGLYALIFSSALNGFVLSDNGLSSEQFGRIATRTTIKTIGAGIGASLFGPGGMLGLGFLFGKIYDYYDFKPVSNYHSQKVSLSLNLRKFLPEDFIKWRDSEIKFLAKNAKEIVEDALRKDKNFGVATWNSVYRDNSKMEGLFSTGEEIAFSKNMREAIMKNNFLKNMIKNIGLIDDHKILSELPRLAYLHSIFSFAMIEAYMFGKDDKSMLIILDEIMGVNGVSLLGFNQYILELKNS